MLDRAVKIAEEIDKIASEIVKNAPEFPWFPCGYAHIRLLDKRKKLYKDLLKLKRVDDLGCLLFKDACTQSYHLNNFVTRLVFQELKNRGLLMDDEAYIWTWID